MLLMSNANIEYVDLQGFFFLQKCTRLCGTGDIIQRCILQLIVVLSF